MSDESPRLTTTESRPILRHRAVCSCGWRGLWREQLDTAKTDRDAHNGTHAGSTVRGTA